MKTLRDFFLANKRVLLRADLNVPLDDEKQEILDDFRIQAIIPTLNYLKENKAKIVLMSHLDRPGGMFVENLKMDKIGDFLKNNFTFNIKKIDKIYGKDVEKLTNEIRPGEILLLENLRFLPEEELNNADFCQKLSLLGDIYINDAFSVSHRSHSSIVGITKFFKDKGIGLLFEKEIKSINEFIQDKNGPTIFIIGGAKNQKAEFLKEVLEKADIVLTGGIVAQKLSKSLIKNKKVILPIDVRAIKKGNLEESYIQKFNEIDQSNEDIPDIGPETQKMYCDYISKARNIFWTGPIGKSEIKEFSQGTKIIAESILENKNANSIIGGGDLLFTLKQLKLRNMGFSHLSTGGGALLDYVVDKELPGIDALED